MTGISYKTSAMITRLWHVTVVFMLLSICTNSDETNDFNNTKPLVKTTESPVLDVTTESPLISHVNITAVTGWIKTHKKQAAIGLIIGVTIAVLIVILICCCISKFAVEKVKRKKKKKDGVLRGYLKKIKLPKLKLPKLTLFKVQPKDGFGKEIKNIGKLKFSLFYEKRTAVLHVKIKKAEDLSLKSSGYVSFNFVQVELDPFSVARSAEGEYYETRRVRNSISPVFDDLISINILPDELEEQTLMCYVYDENKISPRDLIGVATLEMEGIFHSIHGKEKDFDETLKWRKGAKGGDILLHFRWNPRDEIFYVTVKECSHLTPVDKRGRANPYVKVEVFDGTTRIFQETTNTKHKTLFPVFNEIFHFKLTDQQKKSVSLIISVKHRPSWTAGRKVVIGQLNFSFRSMGDELEHWKSTLSSGKDVEMMHSLRAAVEVPRKRPSKKTKGQDIIDVLSEEENLLEDEDDILL